MEKSSSSSSWGWTLLTQILLCFALFIAFKIGGDSQRFKLNNMKARGSSLDLYFLSVRGGSRPLNHQTHLLKQMKRVAEIYDVKFVINISEFGEDDPLMQNGTMHLPSSKVPWYTTNTLQGQGKQFFLKHIQLQNGKTLDLIVIDTGSLQDSMGEGRTSENEKGHISWLTRTLEMTDCDWRIVVGYDSLLVCEEHEDKMAVKKKYESLYNLFTKHEVNAYLSKQACSNSYIRKSSIAHIGNLGPADEYSSSNGNTITTSDTQNGFFLHRVGLLEIVSYFVNPASEVMFMSALHARGKEDM